SLVGSAFRLPLAFGPGKIWKTFCAGMSRLTKIWPGLVPVDSCQATHGTVGFAGFSEPAATLGFSALAFGSLFRRQAPGSSLPGWNMHVGPLPTGTHLPPRSPWAASGTNLAANTFWLFGAAGTAPAGRLFGSSYQTAHGTVLF